MVNRAQCSSPNLSTPYSCSLHERRKVAGYLILYKASSSAGQKILLSIRNDPKIYEKIVKTT